MIEALLMLLACQMVGEALVLSLHLPVPGPVLGMVLMFCALLLRGRKAGTSKDVPLELEKVSDTLLQNLSLLFVPAAVGIIQHFDLLKSFGLGILVTLLVSTIITLGATALIFEHLSRWRSRPTNENSQS